MDASKEEHEAFLQPSKQHNDQSPERKTTLGRIWPYIRLLVEVVMIMCIFVLSTNAWRSETDDSLRKTPVPNRE